MMDINWSKSKAEIKKRGRIYFTISCRVYKVTEHPKYKNGEWSEEQVFKEFLESFEPDPSSRDGKVSVFIDSHKNE